MISGDIEIKGLKQLRKYLDQFPEFLQDEAFDEVKKSTFEAQNKVQKRITTGSNGGLVSRSGEARRSIKADVKGQSFSNLSAKVYTNSPYLPIHEKGGTIRAKKAFRNLPGGPYLAIPSDINKTPSGVTRKTVRQSFNSGGYIQKIKNPKKAKFMVMGDKGPEHWLVKQVKIPARLEMIKTVEDEIPTLYSNLQDLIMKNAKNNLPKF